MNCISLRHNWRISLKQNWQRYAVVNPRSPQKKKFFLNNEAVEATNSMSGKKPSYVITKYSPTLSLSFTLMQSCLHDNSAIGINNVKRGFEWTVMFVRYHLS